MAAATRGSRRGLSPRVRGNPQKLDVAGGRRRSIPACAGEPDQHTHILHIRRVYPRVCGGTSISFSRMATVWGLSPRVRGTSKASDNVPNRRGLSPRVRGNRLLMQHHFQGERSIPRVRGNREDDDGTGKPAGSIPACAGEPRWCGHSAPRWSVYPRVCGGTVSGGVIGHPWAGLSPRVRGNQGRQASPPVVSRSIPACAGEPHRAIYPVSLAEVYPRVCGGTCLHGAKQDRVDGLSPRVRGNLIQPCRANTGARSIPACAGEPAGGVAYGAPGEVYPRVCGGTASMSLAHDFGGGLSPRVRGNQGWGRTAPGIAGSIPACAGEPDGGPAYPTRREVYPRVCGGT